MTSFPEKPRDPERYELVYQLVSAGHADHEVVKVVSKEFECSGNTVRNDIRRLVAEMKETNDAIKADRRHLMRHQLSTLQAEVRSVARLAREGYSVIGPDGEPTMVQDPKTASMALGTAEKVFGRLAQLDGISESDRLKADLLRQKLLETFSEEELAVAIKGEAEAAIKSMSDEELGRLIEARKEGL